MESRVPVQQFLRENRETLIRQLIQNGKTKIQIPYEWAEGKVTKKYEGMMVYDGKAIQMKFYSGSITRSRNGYGEFIEEEPDKKTTYSIQVNSEALPPT
ncbi:MAG: hypothetical protein ACD_28C00330G0004 [uncultured bacterium]|nr:MAG: hypothetical protein ACD_28C00330G0004 [uncultured bacterium]KKT76045.1 MAG: hypothetical protein UW70_C0023G0023 [Candidatus Peregrinibacteria bacterium GW2011_GWA2_44_7]